MNQLLKNGTSSIPTRGSLFAWDPFRAMDQIFGQGGGEPANWGSARGAYVPEIEVREVQDKYVLSADLPGLSADDVDISVRDNLVTLSGKREENKEEKSDRVHVVERRYGSFSRTVSFPKDADLGQVQAAMRNGVLSLTINKRAEAQPRKIQIKASE